MRYLGVFLVAAVNCVVLFFVSFLAAGGDGSADGIHRVWAFGFTWIALVSLVALVVCARKGGATGMLVAAGALPSAFVLAIVLVVGGSTLGLHLR